MGMSLTEKCTSTRSDFWPLTLKTFSALPTHMTNVIEKYRDVTSRDMDVNGQTEGWNDNQNTKCLSHVSNKLTLSVNGNNTTTHFYFIDFWAKVGLQRIEVARGCTPRAKTKHLGRVSCKCTLRESEKSNFQGIFTGRGGLEGGRIG